MENAIFTFLSLFCLVLGVLGAILPALPGPPLSWVGLWLFKYTMYANYGWGLLLGAGVLAILVSVFDYVLPIYGAKKWGGSRYGMWGTTIGLVLGIFFSPFGLVSIFVLPFLGAFLGEYIFQRMHHKHAFKAALGSFAGFAISTGLSLCVSLLFLGYALWNFFD